MLSWRDAAYYRSDPWRGRLDTEGGGVLVNQSPHQLDLLRWFMGRGRGGQRLLGQPEPSLYRGRGHRRGHPPLPQRRPGFDRHQPRQKPGIYTKVHVHGSNGASVGVETDPGATFIAGMTGVLRAAAQRPLDDPRRRTPPERVPGRGPRSLRRRRPGRFTTMRSRSRTSCAPCWTIGNPP